MWKDWGGFREQDGRNVAHDERRERGEEDEKTGIGGRVWRVE